MPMLPSIDIKATLTQYYIPRYKELLATDSKTADEELVTMIESLVKVYLKAYLYNDGQAH